MKTQYPCPFCKVSLEAIEGSQTRKEGFSLFCSNKETCATEVYGYGRTVDKAYEIICDRFQLKERQNIIKEIRPDVVKKEVYSVSSIIPAVESKPSGIVSPSGGKRGRKPIYVNCNRCSTPIYTSEKARNGGFCNKCSGKSS